MLKVNGVRVSTIAHATEDVGKVIIAIAHLSRQGIELSKVKRMRLKGHYGNEITTITISLKGVSADSFFRLLWTQLAKIDRLSVIERLETRLDDDGRFYMRLDKQKAFQGEFRLTEQDPIKLEVSFKNSQDPMEDQPTLLRQMFESETFSPHIDESPSTPRGR